MIASAQSAADFTGSDQSRFAAVASRLRSRYGIQTWRSSGPPLDELISTVLSQHTSDINTSRSFASLQATFPDLRSVADAPTSAVADAIRCGGLAEIKAPRIQAILRAIEAEPGAISLDWLADRSTEEARNWLTSLPGVGPKTAACVLLFSLGRPAMPVDTHVFRVAGRLELIETHISPAKAHVALEHATGPDRDRVYELHLNLIAHGRMTCRARRPDCRSCVLVDLCPASVEFLASARQY